MNNGINYYHLLFKGIVFALICLCLKSCMNNVAKADYYDYTDYNRGGTPRTVDVMPSSIPNTYTVHSTDSSNGSSNSTTVQVVPTCIPNTYVVHPVGSDGSPITVQTIQKY